ATGEKYVNYWMHNGFVRVNEEKMSKSLGNFFTVREVLARYRPEVIRFFILSSHYRSALNYSDEQLDDAGVALTRLYTALRDVASTANTRPFEEEYKNRFEQAMDDDFNTPVAVAVLFDLARELNKTKGHDETKAEHLAATLRGLAGLLGILQDDPELFLKAGVMVLQTADLDLRSSHVSDDVVAQQIQARLDAKKAKDWAMADKIRQDLAAQGVILEDSPDGTTRWRRE
ncbi:MAG: class I tRNA ligase family protein, partial [Methylococcaceae bacterium]